MTCRSDAMKPFPGELKREASRSHPYILSEEQKDWLRDTYPVTENRKMMAMMGVSWPTLHKMAYGLGLSKTEEGLAAIRERNREEYMRMIKHHRLLMMSGHKVLRCTNIKAQPYTRRQVDLRRCALDRGYLLDKDISEGSRGRYAIYYDDETQRSARFEETCKRHGLRVEKDD